MEEWILYYGNISRWYFLLCEYPCLHVQVVRPGFFLQFLHKLSCSNFLNISKATPTFAFCMNFSSKPYLEQFTMQCIALSLHLYIHGKIEELLDWVLIMRELCRRLMDRMHSKWYTGCFYQLSQTNLTFGR